ncbi:hypothetical protein NKH95_01650 [Mesorhizobium sp. M0848]
MSVRAMKGGALDFLTKPFRDQDLIDAVAAAIERSRASHAEASGLKARRSRFQSLTGREREVMLLTTDSLMNKQIVGAWDRCGDDQDAPGAGDAEDERALPCRARANGRQPGSDPRRRAANAALAVQFRLKTRIVRMAMR